MEVFMGPNLSTVDCPARYAWLPEGTHFCWLIKVWYDFCHLLTRPLRWIEPTSDGAQLSWLENGAPVMWFWVSLALGVAQNGENPFCTPYIVFLGSWNVEDKIEYQLSVSKRLEILSGFTNLDYNRHFGTVTLTPFPSFTLWRRGARLWSSLSR